MRCLLGFSLPGSVRGAVVVIYLCRIHLAKLSESREIIQRESHEPVMSVYWPVIRLSCAGLSRDGTLTKIRGGVHHSAVNAGRLCDRDFTLLISPAEEI